MTRRLSLSVRTLLLVGLPAAAAIARESANPSTPPPAASTVTFDQALLWAESEPTAQAPETELRARRAGDRDIGKGSWAGTNVTVMPGATVSSPAGTGFEMQVNATQGWNLRDLGGALQDAAQAERRALAARARAAALTARLSSARAWLELFTLERSEEEARRRVMLGGQRVEAARRALEAGVATRRELDEAQARQAELQAHALELEGRRFAAANRLAVSLGRLEAGALATRGEAPAPELPSPEEVRARLEQLEQQPEVVARRLVELATRARRVEAEASWGPILQIGAQVERASDSSWVTYGIVGATLPSSGQAQRQRSELHGQAERESLETTAARVRARAELEDALHELEHGRQELDSLEQVLLPALAQLEAARRRSLEKGLETLFGVYAAEERRRAAEEARLAALGRERWARVRLWLLLDELYRSSR